jgi:hypothetical protein
MHFGWPKGYAEALLVEFLAQIMIARIDNRTTAGGLRNELTTRPKHTAGTAMDDSAFTGDFRDGISGVLRGRSRGYIWV